MIEPSKRKKEITTNPLPNKTKGEQKAEDTQKNLQSFMAKSDFLPLEHNLV